MEDSGFRSWSRGLGLACLGLAAAGSLPPVRAASESIPVSETPPIVLPPFIVSEQAMGVSWTYAEIPGYEVLSMCSPSTTRRFIRSVWLVDRCLEAIVPPEFQFQSSVPTALVLYRDDLAADMSRQMMAAIGKHGVPPRPVYVPQDLFLPETDSISTYCLTGEEKLSDPLADRYFVPLTWAPENVRIVLKARNPPLPDWYVCSVVRLFDFPIIVPGRITFPAAVWINPKKTDEILENAAWTDPDTGMPTFPKGVGIGLLPMQTILAPRPPDGKTPEEKELQSKWDSQSELFVRWALDPEHSATRPGFWNFLRRVGSEPPSENVFRDCFGFGYDEMEDRLGKYFATATHQEMVLAVHGSLSVPRVKIRPASRAEIGRIKGDWERRSLASIRTRFPDLVPLYVDHARTTLMTPYDEGENDPRLVAEIGLLEFESGEVEQARPFLAIAVRENVVHPRVYLDLARIRYRDALKHPAAPDGKLGDGQVAGIDELFAGMRRQSPQLLEAYELMVQVWTDSTVRPSRDDLKALDDGARLFRDPHLTAEVASLEARASLSAEAHSLAEIAP